jgi:hypothetical protein
MRERDECRSVRPNRAGYRQPPSAGRSWSDRGLAVDGGNDIGRRLARPSMPPAMSGTATGHRSGDPINNVLHIMAPRAARLGPSHGR